MLNQGRLLEDNLEFFFFLIVYLPLLDFYFIFLFSPAFISSSYSVFISFLFIPSLFSFFPPLPSLQCFFLDILSSFLSLILSHKLSTFPVSILILFHTIWPLSASLLILLPFFLLCIIRMLPCSSHGYLLILLIFVIALASHLLSFLFFPL